MINSILSRTVSELSQLIVTGRSTAGIAFTQQAILRFIAPQGRHDSRISMKFGTAEGTGRSVPSAVPNFTLIREYLGVSGPQKTRTPCPMSMKSVQFIRVIGLQKVLIFGAIRLVN